MALLFIDGFDAGDITAKWSVPAGTWSYTSSTRFGTGGAASSNGGGQTLRSITPSAQIFLGFAARVTNFTSRTLFTLRGDSGATSHISLTINTDGSLTLSRGGGTTLSSPGTVNINVWHHYEISATVADAGGNVVVKVDGTTVINFTGDTKSGGTSTNIDTVVIGQDNSIIYDDLYICDNTGSAPYNTFLGDVRVNTVTPSAAGASTNFTPSSGANYTTVDELPYSATDYVTATAAGTRDTYTMSDLSGSYTILAVQNNVVAKKADAGGTAIKPALVSGGTVYYGANRTLTVNDGTASDLRIVDPATSAAWTLAGVNSLEAGMEIA
jgi:hypothetical protein